VDFGERRAPIEPRLWFVEEAGGEEEERLVWMCVGGEYEGEDGVMAGPPDEKL